MKAASSALRTLIESGDFDAWECYTFALKGGGTLLMSGAPFAIRSGATTWSGTGPITQENGGSSSASRAHWKVGTDVDTWQLTVAPRKIDSVTGAANPDKIGDQPFLAGARAGLLDAADTTIQRAYFDPATFIYPPPVAGAAPIGFLTIFRGSVGDIEISDGQVIITILDYRQLLTALMPRNLFQAGCIHTLYDSGCKLSAAAFVKSGAVTSAVSRSLLTTSAPAPAGSGTYALGRIVMTSGENAGLVRTIQAWDGLSAIQVSPPFPFLPAASDTALLYPGCDKTMVACTAFNNLTNFRGYPFIPPPTVTSPTG